MEASVSRRNFLAGAGVAAASLAAFGIAGCAPNGEMSAATDSGSWDSESDVLVVGAGGAGLTAALVAARGGASVTVLEAAAMAGGNTSNSSGVIQAAGTEEQKAYAGVSDDTPEKHAEYYLQCGEGQLDEGLVRYACEQAPSCIEFMKELGIKYEVVYGNGIVPNVDPNIVAPRIHLAGTDENDLMYGQAHVAALLKAAEEAGVSFVYNTAALQLVQNDEARLPACWPTTRSATAARKPSSWPHAATIAARNSLARSITIWCRRSKTDARSLHPRTRAMACAWACR